MTIQNNDKKKYLTEIFAISRFKPTDTKEFSIEDPDIPIKVTIKNFYEYLPMLNKEKHYLICHCLTESESFEEARDKSELYLTEHLNYLSLITNQKSYILRTSRTIEWEKGLHERKVRMWIPLNLIFGRISLDINDNFPKEDLNQISNGFNFFDDNIEKREKLLSLFCVFNEIKQIQDEYAVSVKLLTAFENYQQLVSNEVYINDIHHKCNASYCCSKCGELKLKPSVFKKEIVSLLTQVFEQSEANQIYGNLTAIKHAKRELKINYLKKDGSSIKNLKELNGVLIIVLRRTILSLIGLEKIPDLPDATKNIGIMNIQYQYTSQDKSDIDEPKIQNIPSVDLIQMLKDHPDLKKYPNVQSLDTKMNINLLELLARFA